MPPSSPVDTGTMNISLAMPADTSIRNCELIVSEPSGRILLDTVAMQNTTVNASLRSNAKFVDVILIKDVPNGMVKYYVVDFKGVNPNSWTTVTKSDTRANLTQAVPKTQAEIYYKNVPSLSDLTISDYIGTNWSAIVSLPNNSLDIHYNQMPGNSAYLFFMDQGLYMIHQPRGLRDTVDCATVPFDTAVVRSFSSSPNFTFTTTFLYGVPDTTDVNTAITLYNAFLTAKPDPPQLMYPQHAKFEKYYLTSEWTGSNPNEHFSIYEYEPSINSNIDYPSSDAYVIATAQANNFSISFNHAKPTYYLTDWYSANTYFSIYTSPDSTNLNPLGILTAQKSKLLQGQDFSGLKAIDLNCESVPGYSYIDYFNWACNPALQQRKPVSSSTMYSKLF